MGCGAICTRRKQSDKNVQVPSTPRTQYQPSNRTQSKQDPLQQRRPKHQQQEPQQQQEHLEWPLPTREHEEPYEVRRIIDMERYSLTASYNIELTPRPDSSPTTVKSKAQLHQKEMSSSQWNKENSSIHDSAHVQSTVKTQSHSCINLSTSEEISTLIADMNSVHTKLDHIVRRRLAKISQETEKILEKIAKDTEMEQQDLLLFAKERQMRQDELYREWLQKYIVVLDEWKSAELARLQDELQIYQKQIIDESQRQITAVNKQANNIKTQLLRDEQQKASASMDALISQIESLSTQNTLQFLGSETMTNINVTVNANVGRKVAGQGCQFKFENNGFMQE